VSASFTIPSIFAAVDKFSAPLSKMGKKIDETNVRAARLERTFRKVGEVSKNIAIKSGIAAAAILAPLVIAAKQAADFEDQMASIAARMDMKVGSERFEKLKDSAKNLSVYLAQSKENTTALLTTLAKGNIPLEQMEAVGQVVGRMAVAFDMTQEAAGEAFIKTKNILQFNVEQTESLMNSVNLLGNTYRSTSADLLNFMAAGGAKFSRLLDMNEKSVVGIGAAMIEAGIDAEKASTMIDKLGKTILNTPRIKRDFDRAGGGAEGFFHIIERGMKMSGRQQAVYFKQFGKQGTDLMLLGQNMDKLRESVSLASNAQKTHNSVLNEFNDRTNTAKFRAEQARQKINNWAISIGDKLLPMFNKALERITPFIDKVLLWMEKNPKLVEQIIVWTAKLGLLLGAISLVSTGVSIAAGLFSKMAFVMTSLPFMLIIGGLVAISAILLLSKADINSWSDEWKLKFGEVAIKSQMITVGIRRDFAKLGNFLEGIIRPFQKLDNWLLHKQGKITDDQRAAFLEQQAQKKKRIDDLEQEHDELKDKLFWHKKWVQATEDEGFQAERDEFLGTNQSPFVSTRETEMSTLTRSITEQKSSLEILINNLSGNAVTTNGNLAPGIMLSSTLGQQ
jgi:TP901 family phage tail tape measure protein